MDTTSDVYELLPFLFPFWVVVAVVVMLFPVGVLARFIVPTVITLALVLVIAATDRGEDIVFTLFFASVLIMFGIAGVAMFPFYKGIVWYIIGAPLVSLLTYAMAVPTVVGTIVLAVVSIAAIGILYTLWRAGPTTDPFLIVRMVGSLVLLAGITLLFFIAFWRVIEYTIWLPGVLLQSFLLSEAQFQAASNAWRAVAATITGIMLVSFTCRELVQMSIVDRHPDMVAVTPEKFPTLHAIATSIAAQFNIPKPTIAVTERSEPEAMTVGYRPGNIYLIVSEGLLDGLDEAELEAVVAHELAHAANMDAIVMTIASLPIHFAEGLKYRVNALRPNKDIDKRSSGWNDDPDGLLERVYRLLIRAIHTPIRISWVSIVVIFSILSLSDRSPHRLLIGVLLGVVYFIKLLSRPPIAILSRARESTADRTAVMVTGSPAALASALQTLDEQIDGMPSKDLREVAGFSSLSILPLDPIEEPDQKSDSVRTRMKAILAHIKLFLFATHPPTERRINDLNDLSEER